MCLSLLPAPKTLFLPLGCLVQPQYEGFLFTLLYLAFFLFVCPLLEAWSFLKGKKRVSGSEGGGF